MLQQDADRITHAIDRVTVAIQSTGPVASENLAQVNGATVNVGTGASGAGTQRVAVSTDSVVQVTLPSGSQTPTATTATDSTGSPVAAGATEITFTTNSTFVGTILGVARNASTVYVLSATAGKTLGSVAYTVTAGSMIIDKTV